MMKCAFISSLAILGFLLASYKIFIPMWLDTTMVASLFFYFGILISETNFLIKGTKSLYLVLGAVICYLIYIFFPVKISMSVNYYSNTYLTVVSGMAIVVYIVGVQTCQPDSCYQLDWKKFIGTLMHASFGI